jgi:hypothetical protein
MGWEGKGREWKGREWKDDVRVGRGGSGREDMR